MSGSAPGTTNRKIEGKSNDKTKFLKFEWWKRKTTQRREVAPVLSFFKGRGKGVRAAQTGVGA